jgi:hypothetical protein
MDQTCWISTDIDYSGDTRYYVWMFIDGRPQPVANFATRGQAEHFIGRTALRPARPSATPTYR